MIAAFISHNKHNSDLLLRTFTDVAQQYQDACVRTIEASSNEKNQASCRIDRYDFSFIQKESLTFGLLTEDIPISECRNILNHLLPVLSADFFDNLMIADETFWDLPSSFENESEQFMNSGEDPDIFYEYNKSSEPPIINYDLIPVYDLRALLKGETQEEKMLDALLASKEAESKKKQFKKQQPSEIEQQLQKVRTLELEMRNEQLKQMEKLRELQSAPIKNPEVSKSAVHKSSYKKRPVDVNIDSDILITIKERLNIVSDKDNTIKECFLTGDLSILLKNHDFKNEKISFKKKLDCDVKFSPNLDKEKANQGILSCSKGYPPNKNVALAKWKRKTTNPINFSFWVSEQPNNYSVQFEIEPDISVKDLLVQFQKLDVTCENTNIVKNDLLEWDVRGESSLELACRRYEDIFPVYIDFWTNTFQPAIEVRETDNIKVIKILEVEKFEIVYE